MKSIIVEMAKFVDGQKRDLYAVATQEGNRHSVKMSLTYEAYLTAWDSDRIAVESLQKQIEVEG